MTKTDKVQITRQCNKIETTHEGHNIYDCIRKSINNKKTYESEINLDNDRYKAAKQGICLLLKW